MFNTTLTSLEDPIPLDILVPWTQAYPKFYWYWLIETTVCYLGLILNLLLVYLFNSQYKEKIVESKEARVLFMSLFALDSVQSLWIGTMALLNYLHKGYLGGAVACDINSIGLGFFALFSLGIMGIMSLHLKTRLTSTDKVYLPLKLYYGLLFLLSLALIAITTLVPGGAILQSSGILCIPRYTHGLCKLFFVVIVLMIAFVIQLYVRIYLYYARITSGSLDRAISSKKKTLLVRFSLLIFLAIFTLGPYGCTLVYAWASGLYPSGPFEVACMFLWNSTVLLNPLVYFYSNRSALGVLLYQLGVVAELPSTTKGSTASKDQPTHTASDRIETVSSV
eukprot:TRINITY_DN6016_c0_g1_i1.p1 TRINITY_DN6016_c0_g1~~TRINITY_DN6016_c0_g1_i1.p1  ORF type:complete len:336 (-),score=60.95 TRINITY_DN6016_c0_g1_i1:70-1077(-)